MSLDPLSWCGCFFPALVAYPNIVLLLERPSEQESAVDKRSGEVGGKGVRRLVQEEEEEKTRDSW